MGLFAYVFSVGFPHAACGTCFFSSFAYAKINPDAPQYWHSKKEISFSNPSSGKSMKKKVPSGVLVIAIFHFILGGCCLTATAFQGTGVAANLQQMQGAGDQRQANFQKEIEAAIERNVPGQKIMERVSLGLNAVFSILLIIFGIGLLNLQPWARYGSIAYGILYILFGLFNLVYFFVFALGPINESIREAAPRAGINDPVAIQTIQSITVVAGGASSLCGMVYPIAVLIVMSLPSVSRAFRTGGVEQRYHDRDDDFGGFERDRYE